MTLKRAQELLNGSIPHKKQRYAVDNGRAFIGKQDNQDGWHGYPAGWVEVPESVRQQFLKDDVVKRHDLGRYWRRQNDAP